MFDKKVPSPPSFDECKFVEEFTKPVEFKVSWLPRKAGENEADLSKGARLIPEFSDPDGLLDTAYVDFQRFCGNVGMATNGSYEIVTEKIDTPLFETFRVVVESGRCYLQAGDSEGIRRAIYFLMDELLRSNGPFLKLGETERVPVIRTRISRCYHSPSNRPPVRRDILKKTNPDYEKVLRENPEYRDELFDDVDYYPDAYLSRLARDGVNGVWITESFMELCRSEIIPEYGRDSKRRLQRLREIVAKCRRYGVKIYIFCIEPRGFGDGYKSAPREILEKHPSLAGQPGHFCTSTPEGLAYVEETTRFLFSQVPDLGGLINLCVGEMATHCCSGWLINTKVTCPRCSKRDPIDVLTEVLSVMERGMHSVAPGAEMIAWPYSQYLCWGEELTRKAAGQMPKGVILQHNFESAGQAKQFGKIRTLNDYWLAYAGPSDLFVDCAKAAIANGNRISAKLQTTCSYELATVPFVPVPGILYKKYKAMHELGVSSTMLCWMIGSCPSVMTKAAGELAFAPFPNSPNVFLLQLAREDWGTDAETVAKVWSFFQDAYENYPYSRVFSYYAPVNSGPTWPLYLIPRDLGLSPQFKTSFPPSGDRIGECVMDDFSIDEVLILTKRMADGWAKGVALLDELSPRYSDSPDRLRDIGIAKAVGVLLQSCYNILNFYYLRNLLAYETQVNRRLELLDELEQIARQERDLTANLFALAVTDSRLGFCPDPERHIFFPEKLQWRSEQVKHLLAEEFPAVRKRLLEGQSAFPEYTGEKPEGSIYCSKRLTTPPNLDGNPIGDVWDSLESAQCDCVEIEGVEVTDNSNAIKRETIWKAVHDEESLYIGIICAEPDMSNLHDDAVDKFIPDFRKYNCVKIAIEPRRLWPEKQIVVTASGARWHVTHETPKDYNWTSATHKEAKRWSVTVQIYWSWLGLDGIPNRPIRIKVSRIIPPDTELSWAGPHHPQTSRLMLGNDNPAYLGWLILE